MASDEPVFAPGAPLTAEDVVPTDPAKGHADVYFSTCSGTLWHYTSIEAAVKILDNQSLRASEIRHLNDSQEYHHALTILQDVLARELPLITDPALREAAQRFPSIAEDVKDPTSLVFVFSTSEVSDDLSQWRGYCPPVGGVALGFESRRLQMYGLRAGFTLVPCVYERPAKEGIVRALIHDVLARHRAALESGASRITALAQSHENFLAAFLTVATQLKDAAFKRENEWRLVSKPVSGYPPFPKHVSFRAGRATLVPFSEISFATSPLTLHPIWKVFVGPSPDPALARNAATLLMYKSGMHFDILSVEPSEVPYRSWL